MSEWCQNKKCPEKRNQNQIRGSKGATYYQSNKVSRHYKHWCSMGCREDWWQEHADTCINAVGFINKQVLLLDDAWYVEYKYNWNSDIQSHEPLYFIRNKNRNIKQPITREQAQPPENLTREECFYVTIDDTQARELAITLGLAS